MGFVFAGGCDIFKETGGDAAVDREIIKMPYSPILVIGGGLAGMYAAMAAAEAGERVTVLCKSRTGGSGNSVVAMSVHRFAPDAPGLREDYRRRFLASGAGEQDPETAAFFVDRAAGEMERLRRYGFPLEYRCLEENGGNIPIWPAAGPSGAGS